MRFIIVLVTVFSACWCSQENLQSFSLTDEDILRCQNLTKKTAKGHHQRPSQKENKESLEECIQLLRHNRNLSVRKDENNFNKSPPSKTHNIQHIEKVNSTRTCSKAVKKKYVDSTDSSNENRTAEDFERTSITDSGDDCKNSTDLEHPTTEFPEVMNLVMPGTKWCGSGNIATNDDDLGYFRDVDRCCRSHDKCSDYLLPGETKYNLTNPSSFTMLHCKCDDELYDCLSEIDSLISNSIGNVFFNIVKRHCFTLDYLQKCKRFKISSKHTRCLEYEIDETAGKVYQLKPAKKYLKK